MNVIAVVTADLQRAPLGGRSRLGEVIAGEPVLRRTVRRLRAARELSDVVVLSPPGQVAEVGALLTGLAARVEPDRWGAARYAALARSGRIWAPDAWRGGAGGLTWFDEDTNCVALAEVARDRGAAAVACVPAAAALVSAELCDAMVAHYRRHADAQRMTFTQAPPGIGPVVLSAELLADLAPTGQPPGALLSYRPDHPLADLTGKDACHRPASVLIEASGRLIADTRRSFERVAALIAAGAETWPAERIAGWLRRQEFADPPGVPEEIEIELTTRDPFASNEPWRPRGPDVPERGPLALASVERLCASLGDADDVRIVLGGFGEPTAHPQFAEVVRLVRGSGAAAIGLRTAGLFDESLDGVLFDAPLDVLIVTLDAATPETYARVRGVDGFERAAARVMAWCRRREAEHRLRPLVVPEFVKTRDNFADLEAFYDRWMQSLGTAVIAGASAFGGRRSDRRVTRVTPPGRTPCRQVFRRALLLADGRLASCDQDYRGEVSVSTEPESGLAAWTGGRMKALRCAQRDQSLGGWPLCGACEEWHRP